MFCTIAYWRPGSFSRFLKWYSRGECLFSGNASVQLFKIIFLCDNCEGGHTLWRNG